MKCILYLLRKHRRLIGILIILAWFIGAVRLQDTIFFIRYCGFCLLAVPAAVLDWYYGHLYNKLVFVMLAAGLWMDLSEYILGGILPYVYVLGAVSYGAALLLVRLMSRGGLGQGDIKFGFVIGVWLGMDKTVVSFYCSFVLGTVYALLYITYCKIYGRKICRKVPFGPFMTIGALFGMLLGDEIWEAYISLCLTTDGVISRLWCVL